MSIEAQAEMVRQVKIFEAGIVSDPVTVRPEMSIEEVLKLTEKHGFAGFPVVTDGQELVGIILVVTFVS